MSFSLKGGVLIIGSLFWQDHRDNKGDNIRKNWRATHLDLDTILDVNVPIRYGRYSNGPVYTMVFDNQLKQEQFGNAKVIALSRVFTNFSEIKTQVESLSRIEGRHDNSFIKGQKSAAWCVCSILINPKIEDELKEQLLSQWAKELQTNKVGYDAFIIDPTIYSLTKSGELDIPWPENEHKFDFLVATSTKPESTAEIPSTKISELVHNRPYFHSNIINGIRTYQDKKITGLLLLKGVEHYLNKMGDDKFHRFKSWDHCFNAFHSKIKTTEKALHLGAYLASWGMYRGSSGLLQKDYLIHEEAIKILSDKKYSLLDCGNGHEISISHIPLIMEIKKALSDYYKQFQYERKGETKYISPTDTLITKVLLGTLGCVPAHDQFLIKGLKLSGFRSVGFNKNGLATLVQWAEGLELGPQTKSWKTQKQYPLMKYIDMYFWLLGYNSENA